MARLALYGNVGIVRVYCTDCSRDALVLKNIKQCCDRPLEEDVNETERIIEPEERRRRLPDWLRKRILSDQNWRCLYCERVIGSVVWYKGRKVVLRVNFDHVLPCYYRYDNADANFIAACHVCNHWKSNLLFNSLEEIQVYVTEKWERVSTNVGKNLPSMRDGIPE